jgi:hypothetical protein
MNITIYNGLKNAFKYLYSTQDDEIKFWRTVPCQAFPEGPLPTINSNRQDLILDNQPKHDANTLHVYTDSDWATCVQTRRSFGGTVIHLAGGTIAYKSKFQPTVAGSSTEAEYIAAYNTGKMILFVCSVLWDLGIPQEAATISLSQPWRTVTGEQGFLPTIKRLDDICPNCVENRCVIVNPLRCTKHTLSVILA